MSRPRLLVMIDVMVDEQGGNEKKRAGGVGAERDEGRHEGKEAQEYLQCSCKDLLLLLLGV